MGGLKKKSSETQNALNPMEELEVALTECKFGRFHIRFLLTVMISNIANVMVSANTSYLLPNAECDLGMTIYQKGILNATPYIGMLASGFFAGFLTDTFGRKPFLVFGCLGIFICSIVEGSSQSYDLLLSAKFFEGFVFSGEFNAMVTMVSELTQRSIRDRMMLCSSSFIAVAHIVIALISWAILPQTWRFSFANGAFVLNSWNIYLYICGLFSLTACILYCFIPESPKYLVAHGRNREALRILRSIYHENTGKPVETFPVKSIGISQNRSSVSLQLRKEISFGRKIASGLVNTKPMFRRPLVLYLILICAMQVMTMLAYNVLRLWYPQLSTIIEHNHKENKHTGGLCEMLDSYMAENDRLKVNSSAIRQCVPNRSGNETYINSIILGFVCLIPYIIMGFLVTRVNKKLLLLISLSVCCACVTGLGWAVNSTEVVALVSATVALTQTCVSLHQTIVVDIFPTVTKSLAISIMMMAGRVGTLTGNILFPVMLARGCVVPFFTIAGMLFCVAVLSQLLPKKKK